MTEVDVRRQVGAGLDVRVVALVGVYLEAIGAEAVDRLERRGRAGYPLLRLSDGRVHGGVRQHGAEQGVPVGNPLLCKFVPHARVKRGGVGRPGRQRRDVDEPARQLVCNFLPDRPRPYLLFVRRHPHRDDVVRVHLVHGQARGLLHQPLLPRAWLAERRVVAHDGGHPVPRAEARQLAGHLTAQQAEWQLKLLKIRLHLCQALEPKAVLAGRGVLSRRLEAVDHRKRQGVRLRQLCGVQKSPVVLHALVSLHPVHDAAGASLATGRFCQLRSRRDEPDTMRANLVRTSHRAHRASSRRHAQEQLQQDGHRARTAPQLSAQFPVRGATQNTPRVKFLFAYKTTHTSVTVIGLLLAAPN
eukprot:scaffold20106_cov111-Isochrysis_galbana.AAC.1